MFSVKAFKNHKKTTRYYTINKFDTGIGKNVVVGNKLKTARGLAVSASHPSVSFADVTSANGTLYAFGLNNVLYYIDGSGRLAQTYGGAFVNSPKVCEAFDGVNYVTLVSDGENTYLQEDGGSLALSNVPPFECACFAYDWLWVYKNGALSFSAPLDYSDFSVGKNGGGKIEVPDENGEILALVPYENAVYVFRENAVQRLDVRGEQTDFKITDCVALSEKIVKKSIAVGRECVWFATESSIYKFDGSGIKKGFSEYFARNKLSGISGACCGGRYFLVASGIDGISLNSFDDDKIEKINADFIDVAVVRKNGEYTVYVAKGNEIFTLSDSTTLTASWESNLIDLGQGAREKVLERIKMTGTGDFTLGVVSGLQERKFDVSLRSGVADVLVAMTGDYFRFTIESKSANAEIDGISCLYALSKGGKL